MGGSGEDYVLEISYKRIYQILSFIFVAFLIVLLFRGTNSVSGRVSDAVSLSSSSGEFQNEAVGVMKSVMKGEVQEISMNVDYSGWSPRVFTLKKGVPVQWTINGNGLTGCNRRVIVKDYNLDIPLKEGKNVVEFTPSEEGSVTWSCPMGMLRGVFIVSESGEATNEQVQAASAKAPAGGSCGAGGGCGCGG